MELLKTNFLNTTTQAIVNSNTGSASYLFDRDTSFQYISSGLNNDLTFSTIRINFDETKTVTRIALVQMNWRDFRVYYNGVTANTFSMTTTGATTTSYWTSNSETSIFMQLNGAVACTSVSFDVLKTHVANAEKALGFLVISQEHVDFPQVPAAGGYDIRLEPQEVVHQLSDGGKRVQVVDDKYSAAISMQHVTTAFRSTLLTLYKLHQETIFVPFGTTTSWDAIIFPCIWHGSFDFNRYSDSASDAGFSGTIRLAETPR